MINTNKLKGKIVENGYNFEAIARELGISTKTFYSKMKKGVFDSDEMETMIKVLHIDDPCAIFFADCGA